MIKTKRKAEYLSLGGAEPSSFKEWNFSFNLRKTTLPICYNKARTTITETKGDPGEFPSVIRAATQQIQLCPRNFLSVRVYQTQMFIYSFG